MECEHSSTHMHTHTHTPLSLSIFFLGEKSDYYLKMGKTNRMSMIKSKNNDIIFQMAFQESPLVYFFADRLGRGVQYRRKTMVLWNHSTIMILKQNFDLDIWLRIYDLNFKEQNTQKKKLFLGAPCVQHKCVCVWKRVQLCCHFEKFL